MFSTSIRLPKEMNDRLTRLAELEQIYLVEHEQIKNRKKETENKKNLTKEQQ